MPSSPGARAVRIGSARRSRLLQTAAWQGGDLAVRTGLHGVTECGRLGRKLDTRADSLQRQAHALHAEIRRGRAPQEQQVTMLHALDHRVKDALATVQALVRQS